MKTYLYSLRTQAPVSIQITLSFQEVKLQTRDGFTEYSQAQVLMSIEQEYLNKHMRVHNVKLFFILSYNTA